MSFVDLFKAIHRTNVHPRRMGKGFILNAKIPPEIKSVLDKIKKAFNSKVKHHPYQPLNLVGVAPNTANEELLLEEGVPILKAFADKAAWDNFEKAAWLTVDVVTTFTGIGNLLKLRHLLVSNLYLRSRCFYNVYIKRPSTPPKPF